MINDGEVDRQMARWMDGWISQCVDEWMDELISGRGVDRQMGG